MHTRNTTRTSDLKTTTRTLMLRKESVRVLSTDALARAVGGRRDDGPTGTGSAYTGHGTGQTDEGLAC